MDQNPERLKVNKARERQKVKGGASLYMALEALVKSLILILRGAGNHWKLLSRGMT